MAPTKPHEQVLKDITTATKMAPTFAASLTSICAGIKRKSKHLQDAFEQSGEESQKRRKIMKDQPMSTQAKDFERPPTRLPTDKAVSGTDDLTGPVKAGETKPAIPASPNTSSTASTSVDDTTAPGTGAGPSGSGSGAAGG